MARRHRWALAAASGALALLAPIVPAAAGHTEPVPIPGGIQIPDGPLIHTWVPGPTRITLPLSGIQLGGVDVDPSAITDFRGYTALAYIVGTATDGEGNAYSLEADVRVFRGRYVASDGNAYRGTFVFI